MGRALSSRHRLWDQAPVPPKKKKKMLPKCRHTKNTESNYLQASCIRCTWNINKVHV
jgi:hypothetical protein